MKGVRHRHAMTAQAAGLGGRDQRQDSGRRSGHHRLVRRIVSGDRDGAAGRLEIGPKLFLIGLNGGHGPLARRLGNQTGAVGNQARAVLKREHARGLGGGEFAERMAEYDRRADAPGAEQSRQPGLDGVDRRLRQRVERRRVVAEDRTDQ